MQSLEQTAGALERMQLVRCLEEGMLQRYRRLIMSVRFDILCNMENQAQQLVKA